MEYSSIILLHKQYITMDLRKMYKDSRGVAWKMLNPTWTAINWGVWNTQRLQDKRQAPTMNNYKSNLNMPTYNSRYPWFDEANYKKLEQMAVNRWLTGEDMTQFMDEAYQYYYPQVLNEYWLNKRAEEINKTAAENWSAILNWNKEASWNMKLVDLSQTFKRVKWVAYDYPDEQVIDALKTRIPDWEQLLLNYLNDGDDTILYKAGLKKTDAQVKLDEYNKRKENINKALIENWKELSDDGLKYLRNYNVLFQTVDEARLQGLWQWMTDDELLLNLLYVSPELQQLESELNTLQLNNEDLAILWEPRSVKADEWNQTKNNFRDWIWFNSDTPATLDDLAEEIYVRENMDGQTWKNAKANWRNRWDSLAKFGYRLPKDNRNRAVDSNIARIWAKLFWWMTDEEIDQRINEIKSENINKVKMFNEMTDQEQENYKKQIWLDPIIENYYSKQWLVESLFNDNWKWAGYKSAGEMAWNIDTLVWIPASIINPAFWLAIMWTDTYARENQEAFDTLINAQTKQGVSYEDAYNNASKWAVVVWAINTAIELGLEKFLGWVETTTANNIKQMATRNLNKEVNEMLVKRWIMDMLAQWLETQARASLEEWMEEVFQQFVSNIAESGYDPDKQISEWLWRAFESWALNPMNLLAWWTELLNGWKLSEADRQTLIESVNRNQITQWQSAWVYNPKSIIANIQNRFTNPPVNRISNPIFSQMTSSVANETSIPTSTPTTFSTNAPTNTQWNTTVGNTVTVDKTTVDNKWDKATFKEELYSIDPTLKKNLQNNPYTAEVWERTQDYIDKNWRPERSNDVAKALIVDVADKVQEKLVEKMEEWGKNWKLYQTIDNAWFTVDLTELKDWLDEMLEWYWIEIEDGKLNFDKTAIDGSEASNIRKIYNWLQDTNAPMSEKEFRTRFKQAMKDMVDFNPNNKDQAWRRRADTPWDKVIKWIMKKANDLAHAQIPELAELDEIYSEWIDIMDEVSDWLVYKDAVKRWVIKDNVYQIIKNLDEPSRRQMVNRLEKLIPWIKDEVNAINQMPKVIDHIYKPSKLQQWLTSEWVKTVWAIGGLPWYLLAKWGWEWIAKLIDSQKSKAWNEVLQETSEEWKAKMAEIQAKIEANQKLSQEQEARLQWLKDKLLEKMATVEKTDAEQSAWESWLADLEQDEVIDMPEEVYDQWEEVTTTPKKKTTKKKTGKRATKLDTKKIASDYIKWEMDWNKYQHLAWLTEEQALEKRWKFEAAIDEEWDKNQDYYNTHQSELVEKFHHLLK